jgi:glycosyltransferase involved in cell wall biosynthesis
MSEFAKPLNILLIAYACEPYRGSEPGSGWNIATGLAKSCNVTVVTRANNKEVIEAELFSHPVSNLSFRYIDPPGFLIRLKKKCVLSIQAFYFFWQVAVARVLRREANTADYDVIHQLTFNSFEVPPLVFLKKSSAKLIWGPIGGGQTVPINHLPLFGIKGAILECMRSARVKLSSLNPVCILALQNSSLVYFANDETHHLLGKWCRDHVKMMIDVGVNAELFRPGREHIKENKHPVILFGGRLEGRKGAMLLLRALSLLAKQGKNFECRIVGEGPDMGRIRKYIGCHDMDRQVKLLGLIPHQQMTQEFARADIFVFPSLRDTSGAIVLEAMATCLPSVCLNHQGAGIMINSECGIKIEPSNISEMAIGLSKGLGRLLDQTQVGKAMGQAARKRVEKKYDWNVRIEEMLDDYKMLLSK